MLVFIDETGDHDLLKIDQQYPLFALGALLISEKEYARMDAVVCEIKKRFFDDDGTFILHSSELKRPTGKRSDPRNTVMFDENVRGAFYKAFDAQVITAFDFRLISCFIRKAEMKKTYQYPTDPYHFSFENLLNRILKYGDQNNQLIIERRGTHLDTELLAEYERLCKVGLHFHTAEELKRRTKLKLVDKKENHNGLQVIDLALAALARNALGKRGKMNGNDLLPELLIQKYACPPTYFPLVKEKN